MPSIQKKKSSARILAILPGQYNDFSQPIASLAICTECGKVRNPHLNRRIESDVSRMRLF
ncbi:hypothetical protein F3I52_19000 [Pantoea sp. M_8]|uniref:Uncharacterized protein n=1 Tax=Pantoea anthophila TaxID=470931 RepID=A0ABY2ZCF8_9GAMM|nr:hypothetical protein F3I51_15305 [Pantoea sp. M_6]KAA5973818.1 hypothetical protein F3I52_19000 [Pantoea sp. M_8]KAA5988481.1 hypothetical protein F3I47_16670 [Pantoea sp. M_10]PZL84925.1 hypothetical protein CKF42_19770 [Pantoea sp. ARC270]TPV27534.1 hypothetical protein FJW00_10370 [Pantoea anthophila]